MATELSEEVEFLKQFVSRSRQKICEIARRTGIIPEFVGKCSNVTKLLILLDDILSLPLTDFSTAGLGTTVSNPSRSTPTNDDSHVDDRDQDPDDAGVEMEEEIGSSPSPEDEEDDQFYSAEEDDGEITDHPDKPDPCNHNSSVNLNLGSGAKQVSKNRIQLDRNAEKKFKCPQCSETFETEEYLKRHVVTHDPDAKVKCEICGKILKNSGDLSAHMKKLHTNRERPSCDICHRVFFSPAGLRDHIKTFHKRKRFPCRFPGCEKTYTTNGNVSQHFKSEHTQNPLRFPCTLCGKEFKRRIFLESHISTHTAEKPYNCSTCGKGFAKLHHLKRHEPTHLDKYDRVTFKCPHCPGTFLSRFGLQKHIKASHENQMSYPCTFCDKRFPTSSNLTSHVEEKHSAGKEATHSCDQDEHKSQSRHNLACHKKQPGAGKYTCYFCRKKFIVFQNLVKHCCRIHTLEKTKF